MDIQTSKLEDGKVQITVTVPAATAVRAAAASSGSPEARAASPAACRASGATGGEKPA